MLKTIVIFVIYGSIFGACLVYVALELMLFLQTGSFESVLFSVEQPIKSLAILPLTIFMLACFFGVPPAFMAGVMYSIISAKKNYYANRVNDSILGAILGCFSTAVFISAEHLYDWKALQFSLLLSGTVAGVFCANLVTHKKRLKSSN